MVRMARALDTIVGALSRRALALATALVMITRSLNLIQVEQVCGGVGALAEPKAAEVRTSFTILCRWNLMTARDGKNVPCACAAMDLHFRQAV
jgi:hypothetical protein